MRIRCTECSKKISIDDAFRGGVCRCPYCRALVFVPETGGVEEAVTRPEAPTARPEAPTAAGEAPAAQAGPTAAAPAAGEDLQAVAESRGQKHIPVADRVKVQGIVSMVLIGLLLVMIGGAVAVYVITQKPKDGRTDEEPIASRHAPVVNPFVKADTIGDGPWVAGNVPIQSPIVYVIDGGDTMKFLYNFAEAIVRVSVRNLPDDARFNILICRDPASEQDGSKLKSLGADYRTGAAHEAARNFLRSYQPRGATDVPHALQAALDKKPKTIVLFTAKRVDDAMDVAKKAGEQGVKIVAIAMSDNKEVRESMKKLAEAANGHTRWYVESSLNNYSNIPPFD